MQSALILVRIFAAIDAIREEAMLASATSETGYLPEALELAAREYELRLEEVLLDMEALADEVEGFAFGAADVASAVEDVA